MTDEELIARLRDTADHARFEPHLHHAAADLIEEYGRAYTHLLREFDKRGDRIERLEAALRKLHHAVCGETGFAACVRLDSGKAYPWPALDEADAVARAALKGNDHE